MIQADLFDLDFLVFSSHKSGTQTVTSTLQVNGFKAVHCHVLSNYTVRIESGQFLPFLKEYWRINHRKLRIISVFRNPIDRHISSFFQWHAEGVVRNQLVHDASETIVSSWPIQDLQARFLAEIDAWKMIGLEDSMDEICEELGMTVDQLTFDPSLGVSTLELPYCQLSVFRFDILFKVGRLEPLLSQVAGRSVRRSDANLSSAKWYGEIYAQFKSTLSMPELMMKRVYESKRHLIDLMYPDQYDLLLAGALERYGPRMSRSGAGSAGHGRCEL